jgi:hypothetical protein
MPVPFLESGISQIKFILAGNATGILGFPDPGKTLLRQKPGQEE